jgi:PAS domain S-box-containing protein
MINPGKAINMNPASGNSLDGNRELFDNIFTNSMIPMGVWTSSGGILEANNALLNLIGYSREEVESGRLRWDSITPAEYSDRDRQAILEVREKGYCQPYEKVFLHKSGKPVPILISAGKSGLQEDGGIFFAVDLTEQKKAEEKLKQWADIFENVSFGFVVGTTQSKNLELMNPAFARMHGYTVEELTGKAIETVFAPEARASIPESLRQAYEKGHHTWESLHIRKDGTVFPVNIDIFVVRDSAGAIRYRIVSVQDISERRKAEAQLERYAERLNLATDSARIGIWDWDILKDELIWDEHMYALYGLSPGEFGGAYSAWLNGLYPDDRASSNEATEKAVRGEAEYDTEFRVMWPDGSVHWLKANGRVFRDKEGTPLRMVGVNYDITERKIIEEEREKLATLVESSPNFVGLAALDGKVVFINKGGRILTGLEDVDVSQMKIFDFLPGDFTEQKSLLEEIIGQGFWQGELPLMNFRTHENTPVFVQAFTIKQPKSLKPIALGTVMQNISEQKRHEEDLRLAKERAEESDRLKTHFLTNISHEIRTPMNGILGFTDLLQTMNPSGEEREKFFSIIKASGERLMSTINDIIEISSIETGSVSMLESEININELCRANYNFFEMQARQKGLQLTLHTPLADEHAAAITDRNKLDGILINLIRNAVKFTKQGSIEFGYKPGEKMLEFYVSDTGIGIPAERLDAVFDRFVQADLSFTRPYEGSGIGLSICKAYTEMLGGRIWVESNAKEGSTFRFTIPWKVPDSPKPAERTASTDRMNALISDSTVLIVEDDEVNFVYLKQLLKGVCKTILYASTGFDAIGLCMLDSSIDLILMDVKMPGMDGYETTRKIREFNKDVIIIAQTAHAFKGEREKALEAGCNDFLTKPFTLDTLLEVVERNLR